MDMNNILKILQMTAPATPATSVQATKEKSLDELGAFQFNAALDKVGLPLEDASYAKSGCQSCYGRGYVVQLRGGRHYETCDCVHRGYSRRRRALQQASAKIRALVQAGREDLDKLRQDLVADVKTLNAE